MSTVGERIRELRTRRGYTQQETAKKLGMGRANYSHIENDRVEPDATTLQKIAIIFLTSLDHLLNVESVSVQKSETPPSLRTWLRAETSELTETQREELEEDMESYFKWKKERMLNEKKED